MDEPLNPEVACLFDSEKDGTSVSQNVRNEGYVFRISLGSFVIVLVVVMGVSWASAASEWSNPWALGSTIALVAFGVWLVLDSVKEKASLLPYRVYPNRIEIQCPRLMGVVWDSVSVPADEWKALVFHANPRTRVLDSFALLTKADDQYEVGFRMEQEMEELKSRLEREWPHLVRVDGA